ncbi:MAG: DUF1641 domain-containing protein [Ignavibacteriae bacterium]|nr:DUF1641 domain-containing protein [Ignavibacteriota bacterium]
MDDQDLRLQFEEMNRKLDFLLSEVEAQRRHRQELDDLKDDLMRVGKDVYRTAVVELDGMHDSLSTAELLYLGKKMLRNVGTITSVIEQLESLKDFLVDAAPLARESVLGLMARLDEFDRKGYFVFMREFGRIADAVVTSYTPDDVRALGDNVVSILGTVKNLTQPDMLGAINNAVAVYKKLDIDVRDEPSLFALLRDLNTPEARRGLAFLLAFTKKIAEKN